MSLWFTAGQLVEDRCAFRQRKPSKDPLGSEASWKKTITQRERNQFHITPERAGAHILQIQNELSGKNDFTVVTLGVDSAGEDFLFVAIDERGEVRDAWLGC